jgi:hypothetical protein
MTYFSSQYAEEVSHPMQIYALCLPSKWQTNGKSDDMPYSSQNFQYITKQHA